VRRSVLWLWRCLRCAARAWQRPTPIEQLKAFHATTKSGKVAFRQVVIGKGEQGKRESIGTFSFQRPGKFAGFTRSRSSS